MFAKSRLIILIVLGAVSFAATFCLSYWFRPTAQPVVAGGRQPAGQVANGQQPPSAGQVNFASNATDPRRQELVALIKEVRAKIDEYNRRQMDLDKREKRIGMAKESLDRQAKELEKLRTEIVAPLARLKEVQDQLRASRIVISKEELANIRKIALIYQTKETTAAAETIVAMCKNKQQDDAVKILYFMSERSAGKVLAAIPDRNLVANLYEGMKRIHNEG